MGEFLGVRGHSSCANGGQTWLKGKETKCAHTSMHAVHIHIDTCL